jgi:hypothetical protein
MTSGSIEKEIKKLKAALPDNKILKLLEDYKKKNQYTDYESALDSFAFKFGITKLTQPVFNDQYQVIAYKPVVKLYDGNAINEKGEQVKFQEYKTKKKCEEVAIKELLHTLIQVSEPEKFLN